MREFVSNFFSKTHIEALLHGNLTKQVCVIDLRCCIESLAMLKGGGRGHLYLFGVALTVSYNVERGCVSVQSCLELVGLVEEALKSCSSGAESLSSPLELHTQVILPDQSASTYTVTNEVHNSCCVEFYLQVCIGGWLVLVCSETGCSERG